MKENAILVNYRVIVINLITLFTIVLSITCNSKSSPAIDINSSTLEDFGKDLSTTAEGGNDIEQMQLQDSYHENCEKNQRLAHQNLAPNLLKVTDGLMVCLWQ